ncbi:MAG: PAS domain S-box protein [Candidatus Odinarchaeota archaeon]
MHARQPPGPVSERPVTVLHVDDDPAFLDLTRIFVETDHPDLRFNSLIDPLLVFEKLAENQYDAIVSDYQMPGLDGLELLERLREQDKDILFIIFTGKGREEVAIKALNLGADFYLQKGIPEVAFAELHNFITSAVQKKKVEESLRQSEQQLRTIHDTILDAVILIDAGNTIRSCNRSVQRVLGYTPDELTGKNYSVIIPEEMVNDPEQLERQAKLFEQGYLDQEEYLFKKKSGELFHASFSVVLMKDRQGAITGMLGTIRDITEWKRAEDSLRESEARYRELVENISDGFGVVDAAENFVYSNPALAEMFGVTAEQLAGRNLVEFLDLEAFAFVQEQTGERQAGKKGRYVLEITRPDGTERVTSVSVSPRYDKNGTFADSFGVITDVTEKQQLEKELQESEQDARFLSDLLGHDVRNRLNTAMGYLSLLEEGDYSSKQRGCLDKAGAAVRAALDLIDKVEYLGKIEQPGTVEPVDLDAVLKETIAGYEQQARERGITIDYLPVSSRVKAGQLLKALFSNLLENAVYHSEGKVIRVLVEETPADVLVRLEDDGTGIPGEIKANLFDRGIKGTGSTGSGLGLYLVSIMARSYGGTVSAGDSELGGARFDIRLEKA